VEALAQDLQGAGVAQIYSSPLLRARETADILATALDLACEVTDALREFDCGVAEGRSDPAAWALHQNVVESWMQHGDLNARIEEGESFLDIRDRFVPFVRDIVESHEEVGPVILVGHGGLYQCMLPLVLENVDQGAEFCLPNAGYVLAEVRGGRLLCLEGCGKPMVGSE
jgi:broad specificity phosphatase PhoE